MPNACRAAAAIFNARYYGGDMVVIDSAGPTFMMQYPRSIIEFPA